MSARGLPRDIRVLSTGQALSSTVVSLLTTVSALAGAALAPHPALSTLPVTATVAGTLLMIYPASIVMAHLGRRGGFMLKAALGGAGAAACLAGLAAQSFIVFVLGTFFLGLFNSFSQYYRFAAIDASPDPQGRTRAIATVTAAGVVGGVAGPYLATHFPSFGVDALYANAFVALLGLCAALGVSQLFLSADLGKGAMGAGAGAGAGAVAAGPRPQLLARPNFLSSSIVCAAAFAVMTLTMNAAPLSMQHCGIRVQASGLALQAHFAAMYLPSLFNPILVKRIGTPGLVKLGIACSFAGCAMATMSQEHLRFYVLELALAGTGWNFMFNGGTLLLADTYSAVEKAHAQGLNSLIVYSANLAASLAAGALFAYFNWQVINVVCLPVLLACWWMLGFTGAAQRARAVPAAAGAGKG